MLCENYNGMSKCFFQQYKDAESYLKSLNCGFWDLLDHTQDENEKYFEALSLRYHSALAAIVFQALAVEAFVNLYGAQQIGEDTYYAEYEKKGATTESKIKKICTEHLKSRYPTSDKSYARLMSLLIKRNDIVHTKPRSVTIDGSPIAYDEFMSQTEYIFKDIDEEMQSYDILKCNLMKLEGKEKDIIQENIEVQQHTMLEQISEMYSKALFGNVNETL